METNRRFSLLPFPQFFDDATSRLTLNILVLPRNQNPLTFAIEQNLTIPDAPAFADATLTFRARIITGLNDFPSALLPAGDKPLPTNSPADSRQLFEALANNFDIRNLNQINRDLDANTDRANLKDSRARLAVNSVQKYLPISYRKAFNFTTPRTPNAKTDDSYHCAVRGATKVPGFKPTQDEISWGRVFAFALRQPLLAEQLGMIYKTELSVEAADFPHGGWLYIDLAADSDYFTQQQRDGNFIKRYAARVPPLTSRSRQVFAPVLFPVLFKAQPGDPDPTPNGTYDNLFIEAAEYDDGFAKIVHAQQPPSRNLIAEVSDGAHPVKDVGIRLGWDDEHILISYMRQMVNDASTGDRLDAPLGVFGYAVDVREAAALENPWESLNEVQARAALTIPKDKNQPDDVLRLGRFEGELPYQVYPIQLDGDQSKNYWLPIYFANWNGHSMVLPDNDAAKIYQTTNPKVDGDPQRLIKVADQDPADPEFPNKMTGTGATGPAQNNLNKIYAPEPLNTTLLYGNQYEFRIRMRDLSGGGTPLGRDIGPINEAPANVGACHFKRYVAPNQPLVTDILINSDRIPEIDELQIQRPRLGYPAVVYTGKYSNPVKALIAASKAMKGKEAFGIFDPDVDRIEVTVEVQTLKMDNLLSVSGKDNYVHLYTTLRSFPAINDETDYEAELKVPIVYRDCGVLHTGDELNLVRDLDLPDDIDNLKEIVIPTARVIRFTLRAVCEDKGRNSDYYGLLNKNDHELDVRYGAPVQVMTYKPSRDERDLFVLASPAERLQGNYLQPDPPVVFDGRGTTYLLGKQLDKAPDIIERLAKQLSVANIGLTLTAQKGERVQFGCSNRIRHTLSPENSSLTFSSKGDLMNHWLSCVVLEIDRDWTWDALEDRSFVFTRTSRFTHDDKNTESETLEVGDIEIRHTASFESLQGPQRNYTKLIFIDAVEPKNSRLQPPDNVEPRFPDTIEVDYTIETRFKPGHGALNDVNEPLAISLPITTTPTQMPKIASAGLALSPYIRNPKYSATEPRQRFLWIEFEEPVKDPNDCYFARVLAYAPDQLISNNHPDLFKAPYEPPLPLDPEYIRVIPPDAPNDLAGLSAMQPMEKAADSDKHYLLPLPPSLHADAPEMFGFFTYEFRVGHYRDRKTDESVWCTAQGRFGRPLRATGIQHPAPTLMCAVNRDEEKISVSAPYAVAVFGGKNVTADPPRTQLWSLLYAQVKQADDKDYLNVLLDDKQLDWRVQLEDNKGVDRRLLYSTEERMLLRDISIRNWKDELDYGNLKHVYKLTETAQLNKDATKYGIVTWSNNEVEHLLRFYGLPDNSSLSVLVVEILPTITRIQDHISNLDNRDVARKLVDLLEMGKASSSLLLGQYKRSVNTEASVRKEGSPLNDRLGSQRILRTSPLTEVPLIC